MHLSLFVDKGNSNGHYARMLEFQINHFPLLFGIMTTVGAMSNKVGRISVQINHLPSRKFAESVE